MTTRTPSKIEQQFMDRAIVLARQATDSGDGPVGCVIVKDGCVLGEGRNTVCTTRDPTAHGEMNAIKDVAQRLGDAALAGATLYTSMEPCPMCGWAILNCRIATVVLGARHADFHTRELGAYSLEALAGMTGRHLELITGVREAECRELRYAALEQAVRVRSAAQVSAHSLTPGTSASAGCAVTRDSASGVRRLFRGWWSDLLGVFRRRPRD